MFPRLDGHHYLVITQHCRHLNQGNTESLQTKVSKLLYYDLYSTDVRLHVSRDAYRVNSTRQSFAQQHYVWTHFLMVYSQTSAGPCQTRLYLISNPKHLHKTQ